MHEPDASRRNHYAQHNPRSEQQSYSSPSTYRGNNRNFVSDKSVPTGPAGWRNRNSGQKDRFNNWNSEKRDDLGGKVSQAVVQRDTSRNSGPADFGGNDGWQRGGLSSHQQVGWNQGLEKRNLEPLVDEWGREIRESRRSPSPQENQPYLPRPRGYAESSVQNNVNWRGHYERPQKRQHSLERDFSVKQNYARGDIFVKGHGFERDHAPHLSKRPRLESFPSHQTSGWNNRPEPQLPRPKHQSDPFADDLNQFEVPVLPIPNTPPTIITSPTKGHYSRKPAAPSSSNQPIRPGATHPQEVPLKPITVSPESKEPVSISTKPASIPPVKAPPVPAATKPIAYVRFSKPEKSALVKQFFMDDEDEEDSNTLALPPRKTLLPSTAPVDRSAPPLELARQAASSVLSAKSQQPAKSAGETVLPLSPVSKSPTPPRKEPSTSPQEVTMDISPIDDTAQSTPVDTRSPKEIASSLPVVPPKASTVPSRVLQPNNGQASLPVQEPYEFLGLVGVGAYGEVFKAKDVQTGKLVAMKKIRTKSQHDGFPVTTLREIKLLQSLHHNNVVALQEIVIRKGATFLRFEYVEHDLVGLLNQSEFTLELQHIKSLAKQLCEGLAYIHSRSVLHRDLKAANLLVTGQGVLKLGDFGLARFFNKRKKVDYTNRVCTYWYRAPELMLGETVYGPEIDIWSAGCIFMEMFLKTPPFCAEEEIDQLQAIYSVLGTPTENYAPQLLQKSWYTILSPATSFDNGFRAKYQSILPEDALDFVEGLLHMDSTQRPSATAALKDNYFILDPPPVAPNLVGLCDSHEYEYQSRRRKERSAQEANSRTGANGDS